MDKSSILSDWIKVLKAQGKTDEEIAQLLSGAAKFSAFDVYTMIMSKLTEEDMKEVEAIPDETEAKKKMEELFATRTGMTTAELAEKAGESFAKGYLQAGKE